MAAVRLAAGLGYGLITFLFIKNADGLGEYASEISRATIHFWSRSPRDRAVANEDTKRDLGDINQKLDRLASIKRETVHVHHGSREGWTGWITTAVGGTVCVVIIAHVTGLFDFSGLMYVTQAKFKTATDALREALDVVSKALEKARAELLQKLGFLETRLENVSAELKQQIISSSDAVRDDLAKVSSDVKDVGNVVGGLETKLGSIEGGVGDLRTALDRANKGIQLLCHVVAESYRYNGTQKEKKWYSDLLTFTETPPAALEPGKPNDVKQLKQNGEGPVMRLMSGSNLGGSADNGGGLSAVRESITRQLSGM